MGMVIAMVNAPHGLDFQRVHHDQRADCASRITMMLITAT